VSDLGWLSVFALILLLMAAVSGWMVWFSRRANRAYQGKIEDMIEEMRAVIDDDDDDGKTPDA
jgi:hypothetical protein